jgi:FAD/FMN-containing dehydrogenase
MPLIQLRVLGAAMARLPVASTAFAHREAPMMVGVMAAWEDPTVAAESIAWAEDTLASLGRHSIGAYVNFLGAEGDARIREAYPEATYRRLAAVKASWDPENVFWSNQNIRPAG